MVSSWCKFVLEKEEKLKDNKIYNTALYCRLSLDDGSVGESGSIQTQKIILEEYAKMHGFKIYDVYVDDVLYWSNTISNPFSSLQTKFQ